MRHLIISACALVSFLVATFSIAQDKDQKGKPDPPSRIIAGDCFGFLKDYMRANPGLLEDKELQFLIAHGHINLILLPPYREQSQHYLKICPRERTQLEERKATA